MQIKDHTKHVLVTIVVLTAFATTGISSYQILQYPINGFSIGENYGDTISNRNKASASDSITILSLADKSTGTSTVENSKLRDGISLCAVFPLKINGYLLSSNKVTNTLSDSDHGSFFDQKEKKIININPDEHVSLRYTQSVFENAKKQTIQEKKELEVATVQVFRYTVVADLQKDFTNVFGLTDAHTESKIVYSVVKDAPMQYVFKNENTLIVVSGRRESDIRRIAEQVGGSCEGKPIFKSNIPRGFVAWRTTENDILNRTEYVKIANADITLVLDTTKFGNQILITDETLQDNLGLGDLLPVSKYRVFSVPTIDDKGKVRAMQDIHMFVTKSKDVQILMNALRNRQTAVLGKSLMDTKRVSYHGLYTTAAKNFFDYETKGEDGKVSTSTEHVYIVTRKDTSFTFVYDHPDFETVESLVDNLK